MSLTLRYDPVDKVVRSTGDPPNGIVNLAMPDGHVTFVVDPKWQPAGTVTLTARADGQNVDLDEVMEGLVDMDAVGGLFSATTTAVQLCMASYLQAIVLMDERSHAELAHNVVDFLAEFVIAINVRARELQPEEER